MYKFINIKSIIAFFILISLVFVLGTSSFAEFESLAGSAILMEATTGQILYDKNADNAVPPASITKLMTLLLGFEAIEKGQAAWDELVPVSEKAWKAEGSRMFLEVGTKVKYQDLITGISVVSANDGCIALAEFLNGSENAFVEVMNQRAKELGLTKTQFKNANGLPAEGHIMSARDIAILARYIIQKYPQILEIESKKDFTYNNIHQYNRNPLLGVFPGADGLKTGWTEAAGYCLVGTAKQNGMRVISVVLNTKDEKERLSTSSELLSYGFRNFELTDIKKAGDISGSISVKNGKNSKVSLKVDDTITIVVPSNRKDDLKITSTNNTDLLTAPVTAGTPVGTLSVQLDDQILATSGISTAENVAKSGFLEVLFSRIKDFFSSLF